MLYLTQLRTFFEIKLAQVIEESQILRRQGLLSHGGVTAITFRKTYFWRFCHPSGLYTPCFVKVIQ